MSYWAIGSLTGLLVHFIFLFTLLFNSKFSKWFYEELFEDTMLGEAGQFLYFPTQSDLENGSVSKRIAMTVIVVLVHTFILLLASIIFRVIGAILMPFLILSILIGPIVYYISGIKKKKRLTESTDSEV